VLLAILAGIAVIGTFAGLLFVGVEKSLRNSPAYQMAIKQTEQSSCVTERLGSPLFTGRFIVGSVSWNNGDGYADLDIPVHGSRAAGRIHVVASAVDRRWKLEYLSVRTGDDRLLLMPASPPCQ
jgi:hypothetical protein